MKNVATPPPRLERDRCTVCGLEAPAPIVIDARCTNGDACARRMKRIRAKHKPQEKKP